MTLLVLIILVLALAAFSMKLSKRIKVPSVVALIVVGLVLGQPPFKSFFVGEYDQVIFLLGDIGLLALMFLAGFESSWQLLYQEKKDAALIAMFGVLFPLILGTLVIVLSGYPFSIAIVVGVCLSISAEATRAKVLLELKKINTRLGAVLMGSGLIDDMLGLSLFVLITFLIKGTATKEQFLVIGSIITFFLGLWLKHYISRHHVLTLMLEKGLNTLIIPFFFVAIGIHFNFKALIVHPYLLITIFLVGVISKLLGAFAVKPWTNLNWQQLNLVGWAMNSRGALELALALVAFRSSLITESLYSSLIVMALITTLMFPFIIIQMLKWHPDIMN